MNLRPKRAKEVFIKDTGSATLSIDRLFTKNWNLEDIHEKTLKKGRVIRGGSKQETAETRGRPV